MGAWSSWENPNYCWAVICKNKRFHRHTNLISRHKIPLGETDAVSPAPALPGAFVFNGANSHRVPKMSRSLAHSSPVRPGQLLGGMSNLRTCAWKD